MKHLLASLGILAAVLFTTQVGAQDTDAFGEVATQPRTGKAVGVVNLSRPAILIASGFASGGKPTGSGMIDRAALSIRISVDGVSCAANRAAFRSVEADEIGNGLDLSTVCIRRLSAGEHRITLEREAENVTDVKLRLSWALSKIGD